MSSIQIKFLVASCLFFLSYIIVLDVIVKNNNFKKFDIFYQVHRKYDWNFLLKGKEMPFVTFMRSNKHLTALIINILLASVIQLIIVSC